MDRLLLLISILGVVYLSLLVFVSSSRQERYVHRLGVKWKALGERVQNERLQQLLHGSGLSISASKITLFRYSAALIYLAVQVTGDFIRAVPFSIYDLLIAVLILLITSPLRYLPFGWLLAWLHQKALIQKDGELISFIRLYENNRLRKRVHAVWCLLCRNGQPFPIHPPGLI